MRKRPFVVFLFTLTVVMGTYSQELKAVRIDFNLLRTALTGEYAIPIGSTSMGIGGGIGFPSGDGEISGLLNATFYPFSDYAIGLLVSGGYTYTYLPSQAYGFDANHDLNINLGYRAIFWKYITGSVQVGYNYRVYGTPLDSIQHLWLGLTAGIAL